MCCGHKYATERRTILSGPSVPASRVLLSWSEYANTPGLVIGEGVQDWRCKPNLALEAEVDADLDTLATALYVTTDDFLIDNPQHRPWRPKVGITPRLEDAELVTVVVLQALLGFTSEARWLRYASSRLRGLFLICRHNRATTSVSARRPECCARSSRIWLRAPPVHRRRVGGRPTPVECGRSRETTKRSDLAGWAEYGYCASHSRFFWGLRLHLVCAVSGLPVAFALTGAKADEREILLGMLDADANLLAPSRSDVDADKNYYGRQFEATLADAGVELLCAARKGEKPRAGQRFFKPLRQVVESVNNTLKTNSTSSARRTNHRGVAARVCNASRSSRIWQTTKSTSRLRS